MNRDDRHDGTEQDQAYILQMSAVIDAMRWIGHMETKGYAAGSMDEQGNVLVRFGEGFPSRMMGILASDDALVIAFPAITGTEWVEQLPWGIVVADEIEGWMALTTDLNSLRMPDITLIWHAASLIARKVDRAKNVMVGRYRPGLGEPQITGNPVLIGS